MRSPIQVHEHIEHQARVDAKAVFLWCWNTGREELNWRKQDLARALRVSNTTITRHLDDSDVLPSPTLIPEIYRVYAELQKKFPTRQLRQNAVSTKPVVGIATIVIPPPIVEKVLN